MDTDAATLEQRRRELDAAVAMAVAAREAVLAKMTPENRFALMERRASSPGQRPRAERGQEAMTLADALRAAQAAEGAARAARNAFLRATADERTRRA
jgi:hypothetical protein